MIGCRIWSTRKTQRLRGPNLEPERLRRCTLRLYREGIRCALHQTRPGGSYPRRRTRRNRVDERIAIRVGVLTAVDAYIRDRSRGHRRCLVESIALIHLPFEIVSRQTGVALHAALAAHNETLHDAPIGSGDDHPLPLAPAVDHVSDENRAIAAERRNDPESAISQTAVDLGGSNAAPVRAVAPASVHPATAPVEELRLGGLRRQGPREAND